MKGASVKVAILSFFSSHGLYFHHAKNQPLLRPPSPFSEHLPLFWPYLFSKKFYETFLVQNLGHNHLKKCNICCLGGLLKEKRESTSDLFSTFQKPYWPSCPIVQWFSHEWRVLVIFLSDPYRSDLEEAKSFLLLLFFFLLFLWL